MRLLYEKTSKFIAHDGDVRVRYGEMHDVMHDSFGHFGERIHVEWCVRFNNRPDGDVIGIIKRFSADDQDVWPLLIGAQRCAQELKEHAIETAA